MGAEGRKWAIGPAGCPSPTTKHKSTDEPKAPTAGGKVAHGDKDAREKAKEARKEDAEARREREKKDKQKQ